MTRAKGSPLEFLSLFSHNSHKPLQEHEELRKQGTTDEASQSSSDRLPKSVISVPSVVKKVDEGTTNRSNRYESFSTVNRNSCSFALFAGSPFFYPRMTRIGANEDKIPSSARFFVHPHFEVSHSYQRTL